jgi:hypothetical protein
MEMRGETVLPIVAIIISGLIAVAFIAALVRSNIRKSRDLEHMHETRIVKLANGKFQVEEFTFDPVDWYAEGYMDWYPVNANSFGTGGYLDTIEEARALKEKIDKENQDRFVRPAVVGVVD